MLYFVEIEKLYDTVAGVEVSSKFLDLTLGGKCHFLSLKLINFDYFRIQTPNEKNLESIG
jgi:hypothetical protein